jgi:hypothetical protein
VKFSLLIILFFLTGCFSKHEEAEKPATQVSEIAQDILLPKALMATIESELGEDSKLIAPVYIFVRASCKAVPLNFHFQKAAVV